MPFSCPICILPYTPSGTDHAPFSTMCGLLIGKSCIEKWKFIQPHGTFSCFKCFKTPVEHDYHPINNIPNEVINLLTDISSQITSNDAYVVEEFVVGNVSNVPLFLKNFDIAIDGIVNVFDIYKKHIFLVGLTSTNIQFLEIYNLNDKKLRYREKLKPKTCTSIAINKSKTSSFEIALGFEDGTICHEELNSNFGILYKKQNFNYVSDKIYSMFFVGTGRLVISVGKNIKFLYNFSNISFLDSHIGGVTPRYENITDIKQLAKGVVLGVVGKRIFVFQEKRGTYLLCSEPDSIILNYSLDFATKRIHVLYDKVYTKRNKRVSSLLYIVYKITERTVNIGTDGQRDKFFATPIRVYENENRIFPVPLKATSTNISDGERFMLCSYIPNIKSMKFESINVKDKYNNNAKKPLNFNGCLGFFCLDDPKQIIPGILKCTVAFVFENKISLFDFYCLYKKSCPPVK